MKKETTTIVKEGRNYVIKFDGKEAFVGTPAYVSIMAAQLVVHEFMAPLKWKTSGAWTCLEDSDGNECIAVGYKVPLIKRAKAMKLIAGLAQT